MTIIYVIFAWTPKKCLFKFKMKLYNMPFFFFFYLKDAGGNRIYIATQGNLTFKDNIDKMSSKKLATFDELIFNKKDEEHMLNVY